MKPPPLARTAAHPFHESPREVALIDETARQRDFRKLKVGLAHEPLCSLDTFHRDQA
jgi:hypothetical protein